MTTYPSNRNQDWTQPAQWQAPAPDAPTMATYFPPPQSYGQPYPPAYAWSAEQPEFNSAPAAYPAQRPWYANPRVMAFAGAGFVAAAAAGLFGALHGSSNTTPVNMANHTAPAPAAAPAAPAPAPKPAAAPSAPSYSSSHSTSSGSYTKPASHPYGDVPAVLWSGNHAEIARWRKAQSLARTRERRPDLLEDGGSTDGAPTAS